jgi:hypothetical protein
MLAYTGPSMPLTRASPNVQMMAKSRAFPWLESPAVRTAHTRRRRERRSPVLFF